VQSFGSVAAEEGQIGSRNRAEAVALEGLVTRGVNEFLCCLRACLRDCVECTAEHLRDWHTTRHFARQFCCVDCAVDTAAIGEYYMVWPDVWERGALAPDDGMLCVGCLEDRIRIPHHVHEPAVLLVALPSIAHIDVRHYRARGSFGHETSLTLDPSHGQPVLFVR
jgi:hypothetical protein